MPFDLSQFHESYFDEVGEHLATIERIALELDLAGSADGETYDELFRAAHSIKGASGIFGFAEMAEATHALEALLDALRDGALAPSPRVVSAVLYAHDELRSLLSAYRTNAAIDTERLRTLRLSLEATRAADGEARQGERVVTIAFQTERKGPERAAIFSTLRDALATLARVESVETSDGRWTARLRTTHSNERLADILGFATEENDTVEIIEAEEPSPAREQPSDAFGFFDTDIEEVPERAPEPAQPEPPRTARSEVSEGSSVRVDIRKVDQLIDLVGEMLIAQSSLESTLGTLDELRHQEIFSAAERLARYTREVREAVMAVRMLPIGSIFARFHRIVRETAKALGKDVVLVTEGDDTELDKGLLESVIDPLTHLVRNAIDHGIESSETRASYGKPPIATIKLRAYERSGNVYIEVRDDGRGIDRSRVLAKARALGIPLPEQPADDEILSCIFAPGFSTAENVTELSGRGVGMDVVRRNLTAIGGHVDIESEEGVGTTVRLRLPLTLAILDGLSVRAGDATLVLPIASVRESIVVNRSDIHRAEARDFVAYRDGTLPLVYLSERDEASEQHIALVVEHDRLRGGLVVDGIEGQHQVVIKSLETNFRKIDGYSGATVLGNGHVALIVDVNAVLTSGTFATAAAQPA